MYNNKYGNIEIDDNEGLPDAHPIYDDVIYFGFGERASWNYGDHAEHDDENHEDENAGQET